MPVSGVASTSPYPSEGGESKDKLQVLVCFERYYKWPLNGGFL